MLCSKGPLLRYPSFRSCADLHHDSRVNEMLLIVICFPLPPPTRVIGVAPPPQKLKGRHRSGEPVAFGGSPHQSIDSIPGTSSLFISPPPPPFGARSANTFGGALSSAPATTPTLGCLASKSALFYNPEGSGASKMATPTQQQQQTAATAAAVQRRKAAMEAVAKFPRTRRKHLHVLTIFHFSLFQRVSRHN